jgi:hypothetical protein
MKAILCFALLAFVAQAHFDLTEFYRGAVSNLPLTTEQKNKITNDGLDCLHLYANIFGNFVVSVQHDIKNKNIEGAVRDILAIAKVFEGHVEPTCVNVVATILNLVEQYKESMPNKKYDYIMHESIMIQLAGETIKNLAHGQSFTAGQSLATIFEIYTGMFKPTLPKTEELSFEKWAKYEPERFVLEFSTEMAKTVGLDQGAAFRTAQCAKSFVNTYHEVFNSSKIHSNNKLVQLEGYLTAFTSLYQVVKEVECHDALNVIKRIVAPFERYPVPAFFQLVSNFVMENPTLLQQYMNFVVYAIHGEYKLSGQAAGNDIVTLFKNLAF